MERRGRGWASSPRFSRGRNDSRGGQFIADSARGGSGHYRGRGRGATCADRAYDSDIGRPSSVDENAWQTRITKRQRQNTGGQYAESKIDTLDEFKVLSVDEKLNLMMGKLLKLDDVSSKLDQVEVTLRVNCEDVKDLQCDFKEYECRLKTLEYRALDQEARGRRQNLIFWGIPENEDENCEVLVRDFMQHDLQIDSDTDDPVIQRAHRIGRPRVDFRRSAGRSTKPRPLIACFRDYKTLSVIMTNVHKLKGSLKGVSRDYPSEINEARKALWPQYKRLKRNNENVSIRFPAKIFVNDVVVEDCFPNWDYFLRRKYAEVEDGDTNYEPVRRDIIGISPRKSLFRNREKIWSPLDSKDDDRQEVDVSQGKTAALRDARGIDGASRLLTSDTRVCDTDNVNISSSDSNKSKDKPVDTGCTVEVEMEISGETRSKGESGRTDETGRSQETGRTDETGRSQETGRTDETGPSQEMGLTGETGRSQETESTGKKSNDVKT